MPRIASPTRTTGCCSHPVTACVTCATVPPFPVPAAVDPGGIGIVSGGSAGPTVGIMIGGGGETGTYVGGTYGTPGCVGATGNGTDGATGADATGTGAGAVAASRAAFKKSHIPPMPCRCAP